MSNYTVNFIVKNIVSVEVKAENDEAAKELAKGILNKGRYKSKKIDFIDGNITFAGFKNNDAWDEID